ncbi:MAG TPA: hypothetical protein VGV68_05645, partial [Terriglobia bacterium]|nr:hypothetical protein [Terriglobia bacterium]
MRKRATKSQPREAESYKHTESTSPMRPDVGTQAQFKKRKPPQKYRYDNSLSPALEWDGQNSAREKGERELAVIAEELAEIRQFIADPVGGGLALPKAAQSETKAGTPRGTPTMHLARAEEA